MIDYIIIIKHTFHINHFFYTQIVCLMQVCPYEREVIQQYLSVIFWFVDHFMSSLIFQKKKIVFIYLIVNLKIFDKNILSYTRDDEFFFFGQQIISVYLQCQLRRSSELLLQENKTGKEMKKYVGFMLIMSMSGMAYFKYFEYNKTNEKIQQLYKQGGLQKYLYDFNEQSAFSIDQVMDSFEMGYNQFTINNYRNALAKQCTGKILQTCAGSNRNLKYFKPTSNLTMIDWSPNMASIGLTKTLPSTEYKYVIGDVTKMPFKDDEFDCVIDTFGLQYVINPTRALQEIRRVCKKNGKIILMNEGLSSIVQLHWWQKIKWGYNLLKGGYFSNRNWEKIIKQFDFEIIHQQRKKSGKIYIYVLENKKDQSQDQKIHQSSQRADFISSL